MIKIEEGERDLVRALIDRQLPGFDVRIFGSRARGESRRFSDLDLAIMGPRLLTPLERAELREGFSNSDLPFRVDLVEWISASEGFRASIEAELVTL